MDKIKLKPCHNCGAIITEIIEYKILKTEKIEAYQIKCKKCEYASKKYEKLEALIDNWQADYAKLTAKHEVFDGTKYNFFESLIK